MCNYMENPDVNARTVVDQLNRSRRGFLIGALGVGFAAASPSLALASSASYFSSSFDLPSPHGRIGGDRIIFLGVGGGPVLDESASKPAIALVVNNDVYLVDCGVGTAKQLLAAGLEFSQVRSVFITHLHLDHTSGLPELFLHGWVNRPRLPETVTLSGHRGLLQRARLSVPCSPRI